MSEFSININHKGLDLECDMCFDYDASVIIWPRDTRATDLRLCKKHAEQLRDILIKNFPVKARE